MVRRCLVSAPLLSVVLLSRASVAILPSAEIFVSYVPTTPSSSFGSSGGGFFRSTKSGDGDGKESYRLLVSQASFGSRPPMEKELSTRERRESTFVPARAPSDDPLLCGTEDAGEVVTYENTNTIMLVPRGECTFERKAYAARTRYKASAIVVYGNLGSRYGYNETSSEVVWPQNRVDYDCDNGEGWIRKSVLTFDPGYDAAANDGLVDAVCGGDGDGGCSSGKCLLTGESNDDGALRACCAWDLHLWLYNDPTLDKEQAAEVDVPAVYATMEQFDRLAKTMANSKDMTLTLYARNQPKYNSSSVLIWALGVLVCALAAHLSASDVRRATKRIESRVLVVPPPPSTSSRRSSPVPDTVLEESDLRASPPDGAVRSRSGSRAATATIGGGEAERRRTEEEERRNGDEEEEEDPETLELDLSHALVFVVMSSASLFVLFYFKIYGTVKVLYTIGCSGALAQVIVQPLYERALSGALPLHRTVCEIRALDIGRVTYSCFLANLTAYTIGAVWLSMSFLDHNPHEKPFFWITQDLMGISICVTFLAVIRLNKLKVATVLLWVAFFYDVFFVFVTPYLFKGKSVMITVATSGGPPAADPTFCEKYPDDSDCQGGEPLPMLLTVPRIGDYQGGSSLLGLGDIVLPGLLLSFARRLDDAKRLVRAIGGVGVDDDKDYFLPMVVAYAVGLAAANAAVYLMRMGQPALLYLVPACVGTMVVVGRLNGESAELWEGPKVLRTAEAVVRGAGYAVDDDDGEPSPDVSLREVSRNDDHHDHDDDVGEGRLT